MSAALVEEGIWEAFETELVRRLVARGSLFVECRAATLCCDRTCRSMRATGRSAVPAA